MPEELTPMSVRGRGAVPVWTGHRFRRSVPEITLDRALDDHEDPEGVLAECAGLLTRSGKLKVSSEALPPVDLRNLVESAGFFITDIRTESRTSFLEAMPEVSVTNVVIFVPPGTGDILWSLNRVKAIRDREAPCTIHCVVCANGFGSDRSKDFLENCSLIDSCSFENAPLPRGDVCLDIRKPHYNLFANDHVDAGRRIEEWIPELPCDFDIQFRIPQAAVDTVHARMKGRKYATVYFSSIAWNNECTGGQAWGPADWAAVCIYLRDAGLKPVLLGREWDQSFANLVAEEILIAGRKPSDVWTSLLGKTKLLQALAFMQEATVNVGSGSSGLTILSAYLGHKVLTFWPKPGVLPMDPYLAQITKPGFSTCWAPPAILASGRYTAFHFGEFTREDVFREIARLAEQ